MREREAHELCGLHLTAARLLSVHQGALFAMSVEPARPAWLLHRPLPAGSWTRIIVPWKLRVESAIVSAWTAYKRTEQASAHAEGPSARVGFSRFASLVMRRSVAD